LSGPRGKEREGHKKPKWLHTHRARKGERGTQARKRWKRGRGCEGLEQRKVGKEKGDGRSR